MLVVLGLVLGIYFFLYFIIRRRFSSEGGFGRWDIPGKAGVYAVCRLVVSLYSVLVFIGYLCLVQKRVRRCCLPAGG
jgi:uncharacterized membrane protein YhaH (DUF805 family)